MRILAAVKEWQVTSGEGRAEVRPPRELILPHARGSVSARVVYGLTRGGSPLGASLVRFPCLGLALLLCLLTSRVFADSPPLLLQALAGQERTALLSPAGAAVISETFTGHLAAGDNEVVCWGPQLPLRPETLRLNVPPELRVLRWQDESALRGRRWTVQAPQEGDYRLTVSSDLPELTGKFSYRLAWDGAQAELRVYLSVANALPQPLALQQVTYQPLGNPTADASGAVPPALTIPGPLYLGPGTEHRQQVAALAGLAGEIVCEYEGGPVRERLELALTPDQVLALVALPAGEVTVEFSEDTQRPPLSVGPLPAPAQGQVILLLGETRDLLVKRTLLAQRQEALQFDKLARLSGFDLVEDCRLEVTNYTSAPARVRLWEIVMAPWELKSDPPPAKTEGGRVAFELRPEPGQTAAVGFTLTKHTGTRADRVP